MIYVLIVIAITGIIAFCRTIRKTIGVSKLSHPHSEHYKDMNNKFILSKSALLIVLVSLTYFDNSYSYMSSFYVLKPVMWIMFVIGSMFTMKWIVTDSKFKGSKEMKLLKNLYLNKFCANTFLTVLVPCTLIYSIISKGL